MTHDLKLLSYFCNSSKLCVNSRKSKIMFFNYPKQPIPYPCFSINGIPLETVHDFKYLGYNIDDRMNFNKESYSVSSKLGKCCALLARSRTFIDRKTLLLITESLAFSYLNYSHTFLFTTNKHTFCRLQQSYNNLAKVIFHTYSMSHCYDKHWLPLSKRLLISNFTFLYKVITFGHSPSLFNSLSYFQKPHSYKTRCKAVLKPQHVCKKSSVKSFYYWAPLLWNSLPLEISSEKSFILFKAKMSHFICKLSNVEICNFFPTWIS
jgi:hypothetical protein